MVWDWEIDGWIVLAGALAAACAAVLGSFLLLRRLSLLGDAISHSVLPGIAAAFLFTGERASWSIFIGAAITGLATVWLIESIRRYGNVEESASIGIVFTSMFALGLVMIVRAGDNVDLDPSCILYGNLETSILDVVATPMGEIPRVVLTLSGVFLLNLVAVTVFYKEWKVTTFDAAYAQSQGIPSRFFHYLLASLVAITCIAAFEAVGNILVIAVLIVPAAISFLWTGRLSTMLAVSVAIAIAIAVTGHMAAIWLPPLAGLRSVNSAAMMSVAAGLFLAVTILVSPRGGWLYQRWQQFVIAKKILQDDVLAYLYRLQEQSSAPENPSVSKELSGSAAPLRFRRSEIASKLHASKARMEQAIQQLVSRKAIVVQGDEVQLTDLGLGEAQNLVRSHRLWEQYLSLETNLPDDKVHPHAESWEHFTNSSMRGALDQRTGSAPTDPHGRAIPPESAG
jgi:manganese/zinc/iron transport system permease protein